MGNEFTALKRELRITKDGSHTFDVAEFRATYRSINGAISESAYVFIEAGLRFQFAAKPHQDDISVFEMGFGSGLNALLTALECETLHRGVYYDTVELFPVDNVLVSQLNYCAQLNRPGYQSLFMQLHNCAWNEARELTTHFAFCKRNISLFGYAEQKVFDVIYYDAFAPSVQPELWRDDVFEKMSAMLCAGGVMVTYCSKGEVRRAMQRCGLTVEKLAGPPGKREIVRAIKR